MRNKLWTLTFLEASHSLIPDQQVLRRRLTFHICLNIYVVWASCRRHFPSTSRRLSSTSTSWLLRRRLRALRRRVGVLRRHFSDVKFCYKWLAIWTPILSTIWPGNLTCLWENLHFSLLSVRPAASKHCRTLSRRSLCWSWSFPCTRTLSIIHTTPSIPLSRADTLHWKCSGAEVIPNGKQLKQYLPKGVRNVINSEESIDSGICQNPKLVSSFVNTWAPASCARVCSTAGRCHSQHSGWLRHGNLIFT